MNDNMIYSKEYSVNGSNVTVEVVIKNGNGVAEHLRNLVFKCYDIMSQKDSCLFPEHDCEIVFEFGSDPKIYDCRMGINLYRTEGRKFIVEANTSDVSRNCPRIDFDLYNTEIYGQFRHETQHTKEAEKMKEFNDRIDNAVTSGKISLNEHFQLLTFSDLKFEGIAETVEHGCIPLVIKANDIYWFRKKFDDLAKIKGKTQENLGEKLNQYYEKMIRMQTGSKRYIQDNYTNGRYAFYLFVAANGNDTIVTNRSESIVETARIAKEIETNGVVCMHPSYRTFMQTYDSIGAMDLEEFLMHYENMLDTLAFPEKLRSIDTKLIKSLLPAIS